MCETLTRHNIKYEQLLENERNCVYLYMLVLAAVTENSDASRMKVERTHTNFIIFLHFVLGLLHACVERRSHTSRAFYPFRSRLKYIQVHVICSSEHTHIDTHPRSVGRMQSTYASKRTSTTRKCGNLESNAFE